MHILIVDDEPRHLRGMAAMIRSMRPQAQVSVAKDGEAALACVRAEMPDVVLSDIQMPNMDGLAFLKLAAEEGLSVIIVMVSAYNLFEYAQTAIRHGAFDYLLKPIDADKVEALLERLEQHIAGERKARAESDELKQRLALASSAYRSRLLHLWLGGDLPPEEQAELQDWPLLREANALVLTELGDLPAADGALGAPSLLSSLAGRLEQTGAAFGQACAFALQTGPGQRSRIVTVLRLRQPLDAWKEGLRGALIALTASVSAFGALSHGIGAVREEPDDALVGMPDDALISAPSGKPVRADIPQLYRQAQAALAYAFHDEWQGAVDGEALAPAEAAFRLDGEQLFEALQEPTMAGAEALCRGAFRELAAGGLADPKLMKDYAALTVMKIKSRTKAIVDRRIGSALTETAMSEIPACSGSGALMELLLARLGEVHRALTERSQDRNERIIDQCLAWIQEHYREDLTLETAAERFHFNPSYFSTLIKSRTGRSFSDYVTESRMREAKELLAAGQLKIYEIAGRCGYRDTKYFTRMFKKQVGLSPEAYKRKAAPHAGEEETP